MKTTVLVLVLAGAVAVASAAPADQAPAKVEVKPQTTCPIMGGAIDKKRYVDYQGKRIYVCCDACVATVKQDPAAALKKLAAAGVTVAQLQTVCPVMGGAVDKTIYVDTTAGRVYFCCGGCVEPFKKDTDKYLKELAAKNIALEQPAATPPAVTPPAAKDQAPGQ